MARKTRTVTRTAKAPAAKKPAKKVTKKPAAKTPPNPAPLDPMRIWDEVCVTDPTHIEATWEGDNFTTVRPTRKLQRATELWGPQGDKWGATVTYERVDIPAQRRVVAIVAEVSLWYPGGRIENVRAGAYLINLSGTVNLNAWKSSRTMAIGKALGQLGFNSDLALGEANVPPDVRVAAARLPDAPVDAEAPWNEPERARQHQAARARRPEAAPSPAPSHYVDVADLPF